MNAIKPVVGAQAAVIHTGSRSWHATTYSFGWVVSKVSPTEQVTISKAGCEDRKFDAGRVEMKLGDRYMPESKYARDMVSFDVERLQADVAVSERTAAAARAIEAVKVEASSYRANAGKATLGGELIALQMLLDAAKAAVEAI